MSNRSRTLLKAIAGLAAVALTAAACADKPEGVAITGDPVPQEETTTTAEAGADAEVGEEGDATEPADTSEPAEDGAEDADDLGTPYEVTLAGAEQVPGPGDEAASGSGEVVLTDDQVCVELTITGLSAPVAAAHIHAGAAGEAGDVVVPLPEAEAETETDASISGCVDVEAETLQAITAAPGEYYVNVHTADFPDGAVRGQLTEAAEA